MQLVLFLALIMFFILSKTLFYLLMPLTWIGILMVVALLTKNTRIRYRLFVFTAGVFLIFSNSFLVNEVWLAWEHPVTPIKEVPVYDAGIVLTGITNQNKSPHDRVYTNKGADRILHTIQLYKSGKLKKVIITGGSGSLTEKHTSEAEELKKIMLLADVPEQDIILEDQSKNTHENAKFTKAILEQHPELKKLLLITSAFHMRRSDGCFKKAGIKADLFSTDVYSEDRRFTPDLLMPNAIALSHWEKIIREVGGYIIYDVIGYI